MASADDTIAKLAAQAAGSKATASATQQLDAAIKAEQAALAGLGGSLDTARAKLDALAASEYTTSEAYEFQVAAIKKLEAAQVAAAQATAKYIAARDGIVAAEARVAAATAAAAAAKVASKEAAKAEAAAIKAAKAEAKEAEKAAEALAAENKRLADSAYANAQATDVSGASLSNAFNALKAAGPEGYALAIALTVVTGTVVALTAAMVAMGAAAIALVQQRSALVATFGAFNNGVAGGKATLAVVDGLAKRLPFAREQIEGWAKGFAKTTLNGKALENAIKAAAAATALMGESGGQAVQSLISKLAMGGVEALQMVQKLKMGLPEGRALLADMGLRVGDFAAALGVSVAQLKTMKLTARQAAEAIEKALARKAAGPLADLLLTFPVIWAKVKEGAMSLFEKLGPAIKPFMKAVKELFGQFSKGTPTMTFFQQVVTKVFTAIFSAGTAVVKFLHQGFLMIVPAIKAVGKFFEPVVAMFKGSGGTLSSVFKAVVGALKPLGQMLLQIFSNATVLKGLQTIFKAIAIVIAVVIGIVLAVATVFLFVAAVIGGAIGVVVGAVSSFVGEVTDMASGVIDAVTGLASGAASAASGFIDGLLGGITSGAASIIAAVTGLAAGALGAFKGALGIASPSKVMMEMGGHMATGVAEGVDDGAPKAQAATAAMVNPKALKVGKGGASAAAAGRVYNFTGCDFSGTSESQVRAMMYKVSEEDAFAGPEAAPA